METASRAEPGGLFLEVELFFPIFEENVSSFWVGRQLFETKKPKGCTDWSGRWGR